MIRHCAKIVAQFASLPTKACQRQTVDLKKIIP
jgi:hypothetical protein